MCFTSFTVSIVAGKHNMYKKGGIFMATEYVTWRCDRCRKEHREPKDNGKPVPGVCSVRDSSGKQQGHKWVKK